MEKVGTDTETNVVMSTNELHGRTVWNEHGDRLGVVREVHTNPSSGITGFVVRERWMLGHELLVPAHDMRMDAGDVIVPGDTQGAAMPEPAAPRPSAPERLVGSTGEPVLIAGRVGARGRFGGLDLIGSLFGALVAFASIVIIGGVLGAIFGVADVTFDTGINTFDGLLVEALLVGVVTLFVACLVGGWAAGRSSRFDGPANGLFMCVWLLGLGVLSGVLGWAAGDQYDIFANTNLPRFDNDTLAWAGVAGVLAVLVLMLIAGALGGAIGEWWHRRVDRAMLDVVPVAGDTATMAEPMTTFTPVPTGARTAPVDRDDPVVGGSVASRLLLSGDDMDIVQSGRMNHEEVIDLDALEHRNPRIEGIEVC